MENINSIKATVNDETLATETYERVMPELRNLLLDELTSINLDIPSVVATTLGALPEIRGLRPEIAKQLPDFDLAAFDKLEDYAFTLNEAHMRYLTATQPADDLEALSAEATALRETLFADASALARRGLLDGNKLRELHGPNGYKNQATDLGMLASMLREGWPQIQGRSAIEHSELERAVKVGQRLLRIVGLREQGPATVAQATEIRLRAFTLLSRTYDDARRAAMYLRWNAGDVDRIAPSLYAGRSNGRRKGSEPAGPSPTPAPAVVSQPGAPVAATTLASTPTAEVDPFGS
jgi:hypothetical protein